MMIYSDCIIVKLTLEIIIAYDDFDIFVLHNECEE